MESSKTFPPLAIQKIANVMATQNPADSNYLKGPELVSMFNALGYPDAYTFSEGRGIQTIDYGEGLSRLTYVTKRLQDLNKTYQVPNAILEFQKRIQQPLEFFDSIKKILEPLNLLQFVPITIDSPVSNGLQKSVNIENVQSLSVDNEINKGTNENERLYAERKKALEESILGVIPEGHPVVFISYSWDSKEHKEWVAKLADDLSSKGIYVLFDEYLESGTTLPLFMEYGITRADKVLVIGTTKYKEKSISISTGVAFEDTIIRGDMFQNLGTKKFIPCLKGGEFQSSFPLILSGCKGYDFRKEENYDDNFENLCRDIYSKPRRPRPVLGEIPDYAKS